ncbi:MAG: DegT/DnrJ/EryC1/StrS family aminotransferase [Verrucomicrobiota bacterium]
MSPISFHQPCISPKAGEKVTAVLQSGWVNEGDVVLEFEQALAKFPGMAHPVALNSGTAALHLALAVAGVGPGDEVILPPQTFIATGLVVLMQRAAPVFADINPRTGNITPESIAAKITPRTKAIMPVHWAGYPCDMDEIHAVARQRGLAVIEDAAHAIGASYKGRPLGTLSRFTAFSFQATKHLTSGDGGALACRDEADFHEVRARRWFGIDRRFIKKSVLGNREVDIAQLGYKYHMNNFTAALGLANWEELPAQLARRRAIAARYREGLKNVAGIQLLECDLDREHAYWLFTMRVQRREEFIAKLASHGIPASVCDLRIDRNSVFGGLTPGLVGQEEFEREQVSIPVHAALTDEQAARIIEVVLAGW